MFNTYAEAQNWIEAGQAKHGKRAFTSRPEYAEAYAFMRKTRTTKSQIARLQSGSAQARPTFSHTA